MSRDLQEGPTAEEVEELVRLEGLVVELAALLRRYANWFDHHPAFFDNITGQMRNDAHALLGRAES